MASLYGLRHSKGLTAKEAAEQIGIVAQTLLDAENDNGIPTITTKRKIAAFYGVAIDDVWSVPARKQAA